ncbi:MAG: hypothetical protein WBZ37_21000, partial [Mycobacterium sp.]
PLPTLGKRKDQTPDLKDPTPAKCDDLTLTLSRFLSIFEGLSVRDKARDDCAATALSIWS